MTVFRSGFLHRTAAKNRSTWSTLSCVYRGWTLDKWHKQQYVSCCVWCNPLSAFAYEQRCCPAPLLRFHNVPFFFPYNQLIMSHLIHIRSFLSITKYAFIHISYIYLILLIQNILRSRNKFVLLFASFLGLFPILRHTVHALSMRGSHMKRRCSPIQNRIIHGKKNTWEYCFASI